jgi:hypothetical protein
MVGFEAAVDLTGFVAGFEGLTFVVEFFAAADGDAQFDKAAVIEDFEWNDGQTLLFGRNQPVDFAVFGQQFAWPRLVGFTDWDAAGTANSSVNQKQFPALEGNVGAAQVAVAHAQGFRLGTRKLQARHERITQLVVGSSAAVLDRFGLGRFLLCHNRYIVEKIA